MDYKLMKQCDRLKYLRKIKKLSQKEFGDKINLSQNQISCLETGAREITRRNVLSICKAFNVNLEWFLKGEGEIFRDIVDDYNITDLEVKEFVRLYLRADSETKELVKKMIEKTLENKKE